LCSLLRSGYGCDVRAFVFLMVIGIARADEIDQARALDQQGVRAFQQGRYRDAIVFFERALDHHGPASELWNIAKCRLKLDEPEAAHAVLEDYLERKDLNADDRREAEKLKRDLETRSSSLTILSSSPMSVGVDGRSIGVTPITIDVAPGAHTVSSPQREQELNAQYGRAIIVQIDGGATAPRSSGARRFSFEIGFGPGFSRYGEVGGNAFPHGFVSASYAFVVTRRIDLGAGVRFGAWGDVWSAPSVVGAGCTMPLSSDFSAAELGVHLLGSFGVRFGRFRGGAEVGPGIVGTTAGGSVGGALYDPTCTASQNAQPSLHASLDFSMRLAPIFRLILRPVIFEAHTPYNGASMAARGAWLRLGVTAGAALDL